MPFSVAVWHAVMPSRAESWTKPLRSADSRRAQHVHLIARMLSSIRAAEPEDAGVPPANPSRSGFSMRPETPIPKRMASLGTRSKANMLVRWIRPDRKLTPRIPIGICRH